MYACGLTARVDRWMGGGIDGWVHGWGVGWVGGWVGGWMDACTDAQVHRPMHEVNGQLRRKGDCQSMTPPMPLHQWETG